jgi:hypothetical protein
MFIGELRSHTGPVKITLGLTSVLELMDEGGARIIPHPDRQFMFELALAYQSLLRRKENNHERFI